MAITTWSGLEKALADSNKIVGEILTKNVKEIFKRNLKGLVYQDFVNNGEFYERTYELMNSLNVDVESVSKKKYKAIVYIDSNKMTTRRESISKLPSHESIKGEDIRDVLAYWIEYGTSGSPIYNYPAVGFKEETLKEADKIIRQTVDDLNKIGIKASFR